MFILIVALAGLTFGIRYYLHARAYESTDDAFIEAHVVPVSPKVPSYVSKVHVDDNQHVQRDELSTRATMMPVSHRLLRI